MESELGDQTSINLDRKVRRKHSNRQVFFFSSFYFTQWWRLVQQLIRSPQIPSQQLHLTTLCIHYHCWKVFLLIAVSVADRFCWKIVNVFNVRLAKSVFRLDSSLTTSQRRFHNSILRFSSAWLSQITEPGSQTHLSSQETSQLH